MANLILHIGCHRTGSTSIQAALLASRSRLRGIGVLYPRTGLTTQAHHAFGYGILGCRSEWGESPTCDALLESLAAEIAASGCHSVVVSSEIFTDIVDTAVSSTEVTARLHRLLDLFTHVRILCFVRHQVPLLESMYRFDVLWDQTAERRGFPDYARRRMAGAHLDYRVIRNCFHACRTDAEVEFLDFSAASRARAVVSRFYERAGIEAAYRGEVWINQSQSRLGTLAILTRNQDRVPSTLGRRAFVNWTRRVFPVDAESLYDAGLVRHVTEAFGEANDVLADVTGFRLNDELHPFVSKHRLAGHEFTPGERQAFELALRRRQDWRLVGRLRDEAFLLGARARAVMPRLPPERVGMRAGGAADR